MMDKISLIHGNKWNIWLNGISETIRQCGTDWSLLHSVVSAWWSFEDEGRVGR